MLEKGRKLFPAFSFHRLGDFPRLGTFLLRGCILVYRGTLSPLLGPNCRFYPSCSSYTLAAIEKYGAVKGTWLAIRRLVKCHPWHPGGFDPLR